MADNRPETWFQTFTQGAHRQLGLVCFPHAGGSAASFRGWASHLPDMAVLAVKYPGRADRHCEAHPDDVLGLAREISRALVSLTFPRLVLFGHSMGSVIAFEAVRALESCNVSVERLFVSGTRSGAMFQASSAEDEGLAESDDQLVAHLKAMGGMPANLLNDPDFRQLTLPYVRSDGAMFRRYRMASEPVVKAPITVICGDSDEHADQRPWPQLSESEVDQVTVPGGHFYIEKDPPTRFIAHACAIAQQRAVRQESAIATEWGEV